MKTELTIEQSQRLIELGVDANKASKEIATTISEQEYSDPCRPIFTLADLLGILPKEIEVESRDGDIDDAWLFLVWDTNGDYADNHEWLAAYTAGFTYIANKHAPELIDATYSLLIWLIENKHIQL